MRAGARFTVSPFDRSCWFFVGWFVFVWGGFCLCYVLFLYLQDLSTVDSWVYLRHQAFRYKDCHYRYDERSNEPKKTLLRLVTERGNGYQLKTSVALSAWGGQLRNLVVQSSRSLRG